MLLTLFFYTKDFGADDSDASIEELENSRIEFSDDNDYQSTPPEEEEEEDNTVVFLKTNKGNDMVENMAQTYTFHKNLKDDEEEKPKKGGLI